MVELGAGAINLLFGAFGTLVTLYLTYIFNKYTKNVNQYRKEREEKEALELKKKEQDDALMLMILKIELKYITGEIKKRGYYTSEERQKYTYMYEVYKERGGNGEVEREFLKLDSLPYDKP